MLSMNHALRTWSHRVVAFLDLLSLGFATIGFGATLLAVAEQLLADTLKPIAGRGWHSTT
jgi:hypothetical protein